MRNAASGLQTWLAESAAARRSGHLERKRRALRPVDAVRVHDGERELLNFSGNDYLGLAAHPRLAQAMQSAAEDGTGAGASALVTGYRSAHRSLENELAEFLRREKVLLCSSGYLANLAVATSLAGRGDRIVQDRLCHASLIDAARLSGAGLSRYRHLDVESLERQLASAPAQKTLVVTDGVFSMNGDRAPLERICHSADASGAWLVVDDAHGIGVLGPGGRGTVAEAGLDQDRVPVLVGTLGKAFGCAGAFVAGSAGLIDHLVNVARTYIYTTAMPPALAAAAQAALHLVRDDEWRRDKLQELIGSFREGAASRGLSLLPSDTPIQPLVVGDAEKTVSLSGELRSRGYLVAAIRPPTVPTGTSRLRITLSAAHEPQQLSRLLDNLEACLAGS